MSGTNQGLVAIARMSIVVAIAAGGLQGGEEILGMDDADDILRLVLPDGNAGMRPGQDLLDDLRRRARRHRRERMLVRWTMTSKTLELAEAEEVVDVLGLLLLDLAVLGRDFDQACDLVVGEDVLVRARR